MPLDARALLARPPIETRHAYTWRDTVLYALGVGADELPFVYEDGLRALPTMAVVLAHPGFFWRDPAYGVDWTKILHGETGITLHRPLPPEGELVGVTSFDAVEDKGPGKGAVVRHSRRIVDANGHAVATVRNGSFLRGDGGCGSVGTVLSAPATVAPDGPPDEIVVLPTAANQALIYRLSGDLNPLHIDPAVARAAGFGRPILHGLCTYGVAGRALVAALCGGAPERLRRMDVRFSSPVYPGETIETSIWRRGDGQAFFRARVVERDVVVLSNGHAEFE